MLTVDNRFNFTGGDFNIDNSIVVNGHLIDIGIPVIRWDDPGGFNGYTTKTKVLKQECRRTGKKTRRVIKGQRYNKRKNGLGLGNIKQFLVHHSGGDGKNPSGMFQTLYNQRKLSVHFATEDDGRIYQFNDVIDNCWHAGRHNNISVGVECCLYPLANKKPDYYSEERRLRTGNLPHSVIEDVIHGKKMKVFAFTDPQVIALAKLAAGTWLAIGIMQRKNKELCEPYNKPPVFPKDKSGEIPRTVVKKPLNHDGLIGHLQCTRNKIDPAGFPWEKFERMVGIYYNLFKNNSNGDDE